MSGAREPQLVLVRHGETEWSAAGKHTGRTDLPLTPAGEGHARLAARAIAGRTFGLVLASPLQRSRRTAELLGFPDAVVDEDVAEWDYGPAEGRTSAEISAELGRRWTVFGDGVGSLPVPADGPGAHAGPGETLDDVARRAAAVVARVEPVLDAGQDVLVVGHGHLLRVLAAVWVEADPAFGSRLELATAAVCLLGYGHELRTIEGWNVGAPEGAR
ncbi:Phosphoglycerate mutase [Beutenbergia cavernae DSM 12333]|uniref:Phosphoglycerate mutase n=1 Tax=Beutenbergia cavernae (strain ATCC BAA-8 / DSM 12333 / CCUG 43141 / JCM 11478 / NBRC 16432 / NCIMB 13614 / HKI 0122) TaxID=471853 RepID=C5C091_BEUC1|nr:histidine phosphatase family protein [Beutenbergia cavernae]ACQ79277.1 Phosphoglycerate mutase [Beutenbergia cavernae DSM 12333]